MFETIVFYIPCPSIVHVVRIGVAHCRKLFFVVVSFSFRFKCNYMQ